jgi:hypothetical protein
VYRKKCGYGNFSERHSVFPVHLLALLAVGNFSKVARMCADRPIKWSAIVESLRNTDAKQNCESQSNIRSLLFILNMSCIFTKHEPC